MDGFLEQNYLCHYGIKGMKWGLRRYQNPDGSLTSAGKSRYGVGEGRKKTVTNNSKGTYKRAKVDTKTSAKESATNAGSGRYTKTFAKINEANVAAGGSSNSFDFGSIQIKTPNGMSMQDALFLLNDVGFSSIEEMYQIESYAKAKGYTSLTLDPSGYVDGFPFTVFAELKEGTTYDQMFPFANVKPEDAPPPAMTDEEYATQDLARQRLLTENDSVSKIQKEYDETLKKRQKYEKLLASVKKQGAPKTVIRNYENEIAVLDEDLWYYDKIRKQAQEKAKDARKSGSKDTGVFIPLTPEAKMKHSITFNEQNYLCHYGIKGMKWGVRRYQNPDGSLTAAGIARYGTKKNLKKAIKTEMHNQKVYARETMIAQKAADYASKRTAKAEKKFMKTGKSKHMADYLAAKQSEKLNKEYFDANKKLMEEHYNKLVNEFGKEAVKDINYKNGKLKEKTGDGQKIVGDLLAAGLGGVITVRSGHAQISSRAAKDDETKMYKSFQSYERKMMKESGQKGSERVNAENRKAALDLAKKQPDMFGIKLQDKKKQEDNAPSVKTVSNGKTKVRIASSGNEKEDKALANNISTINKNATKKFVDDNIEYLQKRYPEKTKSQLYNSFEIDSIADNGVVDIKAKEGSGLGNIGYPYVEMDRKTGKMYRGGWDD